MKKIKIYQKNNEAIIQLIDSDPTNLEIYSKNIVKIFESTKISILQIENKSLILKPSQINAILIEDEKEDCKKQDSIEDVIKD